MQLPESVTGTVTTCDVVDESAPSKVKRRPFGSALRSRLNNIVSMYVPSTSNGDRHPGGEVDEHTELLSGNDTKLDFSSTKSDALYVIRLLYSGDVLKKGITNEVSTVSFLSADETPSISAIAADSHTIYLSLEGIPYVFLLKTHSSSESESENTDTENRTDLDVNPFKGFIRLTVPGVGDLVPHELCVHSPTAETRVLYTVGWVLSTNSDKPQAPMKHWLLAKFSLSGQYLARTRVYTYQRYSGLAVDSMDGKLLLACPVLCNGIKPNVDGPVNGSTENSAGQLCKLTPGFERRIFSVTMGNDLAIYRPDFVSQESAGRCCWASVQRTPRQNKVKNTKSRNTPQKPTVARRLFAFPGRQLEGADRRSPREWLHVVSWDFADLDPGRIAAFDADRLLVVDATTGTLSYITWAENADKPTLHRITRPKSKPISLICTNHHAKSNYPPVAYFVSGMNVYSFEFNQQTVDT